MLVSGQTILQMIGKKNGIKLAKENRLLFCNYYQEILKEILWEDQRWGDESVQMGTRQLSLENTLSVQGGILLDTIWISHQRVTLVACYSIHLCWQGHIAKLMKPKLGKLSPNRRKWGKYLLWAVTSALWEYPLGCWLSYVSRWINASLSHLLSKG